MPKDSIGKIWLCRRVSGRWRDGLGNEVSHAPRADRRSCLPDRLDHMVPLEWVDTPIQMAREPRRFFPFSKVSRSRFAPVRRQQAILAFSEEPLRPALAGSLPLGRVGLARGGDRRSASCYGATNRGRGLAFRRRVPFALRARRVDVSSIAESGVASDRESARSPARPVRNGPEPFDIIFRCSIIGPPFGRGLTSPSPSCELRIHCASTNAVERSSPRR